MTIQMTNIRRLLQPTTLLLVASLLVCTLALAQAPAAQFRSSSGGWNLATMPDTLEGRWKLVDKTQFHRLYIDMQSITSRTVYVRFWLKTAFAEPLNLMGLKRGLDTLPVTWLEHVFINCTRREYAYGQRKGWTRTNSPVEYPFSSDEGRIYKAILPDGGLEERLFNALCSPR